MSDYMHVFIIFKLLPSLHECENVTVLILSFDFQRVQKGIYKPPGTTSLLPSSDPLHDEGSTSSLQTTEKDLEQVDSSTSLTNTPTLPKNTSIRE